jgi:nitrogen fixation NifU-like protein
MAGAYAVYQAQILDHYKHPRNRGGLDAATHEASESNPLCGDAISMALRVDGAERIVDVRFDGEGCAISVASASILTEYLKGKTLAEARTLDRETVLKNVGVPLSAVREQCALLSLHVLKRAVGETKGS